MGLNCGCPAADALPDITILECSVSVGQIQKLIFQRLYASAGTLNAIPAGKGAGGIEVLATWTALLAATGSTKAVITPYVQGPVVEPGAIKTFGGGNETLGGIELVVGREPTTFAAKIYNSSQLTIQEMKQLQCEQIGVWLIDEYGKIIGQADDLETPTEYTPFPIRKVFIGDVKLGGFDEPDSNAIEFSFPPNWSDNLAIITPDNFNPLTDLALAGA